MSNLYVVQEKAAIIKNRENQEIPNFRGGLKSEFFRDIFTLGEVRFSE
ncbi:hypothetical protein [Pedobacter sp. FW305-3-2-15-E-R2A2]|jgi:hypothetical protein